MKDIRMKIGVVATNALLASPLYPCAFMFYPSSVARILFVCLGNICRSPMAEAILVHRVRELNLASQIEIDSAGTGDWHIGDAPHEGTLGILKTNGIEHPMKARQIIASDLDEFDYLIVMDDKNERDVRAMPTGRAHIARLLDYLPAAKDKNVPDPYFTGDFDAVYQMVSAACDNLLAEVRREQKI